MDSITIALISAGAVILAAIITYFASTSKMKQKMAEDHTQLSTEHNSLSRDIKDEHSDLSRDIKEGNNGLSRDIKNVDVSVNAQKQRIENVEKMLSEEKIKQELRYENLNDTQRIITSGIDSVKALSEEMKRLQTENAELKNKLEKLSEENHKLRQYAMYYKRNSQNEKNRSMDDDEPERE